MPLGTCREFQTTRRAGILSDMTGPHSEHPPTTDADWDERYAGASQVWSGQPNSALVVELADITPGRVLDVGCGEGADAVWLARQGWEVTALDVSQVALERASTAADAAGVSVRWVHSGLVGAQINPEGFDLVSAQYPALPSSPEHDAERTLIEAVAPGGHLLVVHHADVDIAEAKAAGFDPADYVSPVDVADLLDDRWQVSFDARRPRDVTGGAGARHSHDTVLVAHRLG